MYQNIVHIIFFNNLIESFCVHILTSTLYGLLTISYILFCPNMLDTIFYNIILQTINLLFDFDRKIFEKHYKRDLFAYKFETA